MVAFSVFLFFLVAILASILSEIWHRRRAGAPEEKPDAATTSRSAAPAIPAGILFNRSHAWVKVDNAAVAVGLDDFAQRFAGRIDRIEIPRVGADVKKGETLWRIHFGGRSVTQLAPISGRVVQINRMVAGDPSLADPAYEDGWVVKMLPQSLTEETSRLLNRDGVKKWRDIVRTRLLGEMTPQLGPVVGDASEIRRGLGKEIDAQHWNQLVDFLFHEKD